MRELGPREACELLAAVAQEVAGRLVGLDPALLRRRHGDAHEALLEVAAEARLAVAHGLLRAPALGDVSRADHHACHLAVGVPHRVEVVLHRVDAVRRRHGGLDHKGFTGKGAIVVAGPHPVELFRILCGENGVAGRDAPALREAGRLGEALVGDDKPVLAIDLEDDIGDGVDQRPQLVLAATRDALGLHTLGDVHHDPGITDHCTGVVTLRPAPRDEPAERAVVRVHAVLDVELGARGGGRPDGRRRGLTIVRMDRVEPEVERGRAVDAIEPEEPLGLCRPGAGAAGYLPLPGAGLGGGERALQPVFGQLTIGGVVGAHDDADDRARVVCQRRVHDLEGAPPPLFAGDGAGDDALAGERLLEVGERAPRGRRRRSGSR